MARRGSLGAAAYTAITSIPSDAAATIGNRRINLRGKNPRWYTV